MTSPWFKEKKKELAELREMRKRRAAYEEKKKETAQQVVKAADERIQAYDKAREKAEAEKADVEKMQKDIERVYDTLKKQLRSAKQQYDETKVLGDLELLAEEYGVEVRFIDGAFCKVEDERAIIVRGERASEFMDLPKVKEYGYALIESPDLDKYDASDEIAHVRKFEEEVKSAGVYYDAPAHAFNIFELAETPKAEPEEFKVVEEEPAAGAEEEKEAGPTVSDIANFLGRLATAERYGKDVKKARGYATHALNSEGEERVKYFEQAQDAYVLAGQDIVITKPEEAAERKIELEVREEKVEPEVAEGFPEGAPAITTGQPTAYRTGLLSFKDEAKEEAPRRYQLENIPIFASESEVIAEACAAVARERGLEARAERGEVRVSYDGHQEGNVEKLKKDLGKRTSAWLPRRKELTEKEYDRLIKAETPFGRVLRKLETENKIVPPDPDGWFINYKIKAEIPMAVYNQMKEEAKRLKEEAEERGEDEAPLVDGRKWMDFSDRPSAALFKSTVESGVYGAECEIRPMEKGFKVIMTYDPRDEKSIRVLCERFQNKEKEDVVLRPDVYDELMKREKGDVYRDFVESEKEKGNVSKKWFSDSRKLSARRGFASEIKSEAYMIDERLKALGPTSVRPKVDRKEAVEKTKKYLRERDKKMAKAKLEMKSMGPKKAAKETEKAPERPVKKAEPPKAPARKKPAKKGYPSRPSKKETVRPKKVVKPKPVKKKKAKKKPAKKAAAKKKPIKKGKKPAKKAGKKPGKKKKGRGKHKKGFSKKSSEDEFEIIIE